MAKASDQGVSLLENEKAIIAAIYASLHKCAPEALVPRGPKAHHGPRNAWYNDDCKAARQAALLAEKTHGVGSVTTVAAFKEYKHVLKQSKKCWLDSSMDLLRVSLSKDPKSFWSKFRGNSKHKPEIDVNEWTTYFTDLFSSNSQNRVGLSATDLVFGVDGPRGREAASCLNQEFSVSEVSCVLKKLRKNASPGIDGLPAEFYHFAGDNNVVFSAALTSIFNRVLHEGYPNHWAASALAPVPKPKGDASNKDDYRGIAVGSSISKKFSVSPLNRLDRWAEDNGLRAVGQSGFRLKRGTADASFILNHLVDKYHNSKKPLYAAFVDFKKAYDWVNRDLLWECLDKLGVHGACLKALRSMYADVTRQVRLDGFLGTPFSSDTGVKQGDPLSPLLFGLLIDRIESFFRNKLPHIGVGMGAHILQVLLYADDLAIMAESPQEMQLLLNCLSDFCKASGLQVNIKKSEIVGFNSFQRDS